MTKSLSPNYVNFQIVSHLRLVWKTQVDDFLASTAMFYSYQSRALKGILQSVRDSQYLLTYVQQIGCAE